MRRILVEFLSLSHVLHVLNQLPHPSDPRLRLLGRLGYQIQVSPAATEDQREAAISRELVGDAE